MLGSTCQPHAVRCLCQISPPPTDPNSLRVHDQSLFPSLGPGHFVDCVTPPLTTPGPTATTRRDPTLTPLQPPTTARKMGAPSSCGVESILVVHAAFLVHIGVRKQCSMYARGPSKEVLVYFHRNRMPLNESHIYCMREFEGRF